MSAVVDTRCSSSSHTRCSSVAPGIINEVNTRRNAESGRAQPTLISASSVSFSVVLGRVLGGPPAELP